MIVVGILRNRSDAVVLGTRCARAVPNRPGSASMDILMITLGYSSVRSRVIREACWLPSVFILRSREMRQRSQRRPSFDSLEERTLLTATPLTSVPGGNLAAAVLGRSPGSALPTPLAQALQQDASAM